MLCCTRSQGLRASIRFHLCNDVYLSKLSCNVPAFWLMDLPHPSKIGNRRTNCGDTLDVVFGDTCSDIVFRGLFRCEVIRPATFASSKTLPMR